MLPFVRIDANKQGSALNAISSFTSSHLPFYFDFHSEQLLDLFIFLIGKGSSRTMCNDDGSGTSRYSTVKHNKEQVRFKNTDVKDDQGDDADDEDVDEEK